MNVQLSKNEIIDLIKSVPLAYRRYTPELEIADRIYKCDCGYTMDRDTHSARVVLMIGSSKRAECMEHASAEVAASMPPSSTGLAQVAPLKRKLEAHAL